MKKLADLKGVKTLNRSEQKSITGGRFICCYSNPSCPNYNEISCIVVGGVCYYYPDEGTTC